MEWNDLSKEERLTAIFKNSMNNLPELERSLREGRNNEYFFSMTSWSIFQNAALKSFFLDRNKDNAKLCFYKCGLLDALLIEKYNEKILHYGINHLSYALLSDNKDLIARYANLSHEGFQQELPSGIGVPLFLLQCLIKEDYSGLERVLPIMHKKVNPKFKMELDTQFYEAMAEKNKSEVEKVIASLLVPKIHMQRNKAHLLINEFISHPALGYAKLAWIKGMEIEVNNPLVPVELLRVEPLKEYKELELFKMSNYP